MGKHVQWIVHNGKRILFVNVAGLGEAEYVQALEETKQEILKNRTMPPILMDLSNTSVTPKTTNKAKEMMAAAKEAGIPDGPVAVVGLSKIARTVAGLLARDAHFVDTIEHAKELLVKEEDKRHKPQAG